MSSGVILGFDFGTQRIGIAVGDDITRSARALAAIPNDWRHVDSILTEWKPQACVVGLPLNDDGQEQDITRLARQFAETLGRRYPAPVHLCDERYSTRSAVDGLRAARADGTMKRRVKRGDKDSAAARVILEQWLAEAQAPRTSQNA